MSQNPTIVLRIPQGATAGDVQYLQSVVDKEVSQIELRIAERRTSASVVRLHRTIAAAIADLWLEIRSIRDVADIDPDDVADRVEKLRADDAALAAERELLRDSLADDPV